MTAQAEVTGEVLVTTSRIRRIKNDMDQGKKIAFYEKTIRTFCLFQKNNRYT